MNQSMLIYSHNEAVRTNITHVLNKYSSVKNSSMFKSGLCFWISHVSVINSLHQWSVWANGKSWP